MKKYRRVHRNDPKFKAAYEESKKKKREAYAKKKKGVKKRKAKKCEPPKTLAMILRENEEMRAYTKELDAKIAENDAILKKQKETLENIERNYTPYHAPYLHEQFVQKRIVEIRTFLDKLMHRLYYFPPEIQGEKSLKERSAKLKTKAQRVKHLTVAENMIEDWVRG